MKYINTATIAGALAFCGTLATAFGQPALSEVFTNPQFVQSVIGMVSALSAIVAALSAPPRAK
jgi:hypothetical protein